MCFGCKKGGNVFTFLETFNGMSFPEAVEFLARRASLPIPENEAGPRSKAAGANREQRDLLLRVNRAAAVFYHRYLKSEPTDSPVRRYLTKRGLTDETIEKFRLGLSPNERRGLLDHFKQRKVPVDAAESLGLIKVRAGAHPDESQFDFFRDRLMFPIFSSTGDVIGFGGRTLGDGMPKYLNSNESLVFNKGRVLYGIHETGKFIRAADSAIVVEGYMDAIALYMAGLKNVVAILGTAFTPDHAKVLKRYTTNVTMLLDGDDAGWTGAERSLPILLEAGVMAKGFALPDKVDPDDFVKEHGASKLQEEVDRAPELFSILLTKRWMNGYHGSPSEKVRIVEEAAAVLARTQNRQLLDLYVLELARQLDVEIGWVRKAIAQRLAANNAAPAGARPPMVSQQIERSGVAASSKGPEPEDAESLSPKEQAPEKYVLKGAPRDELFLLSLVLHHENLMSELLEAGTDELFSILSHDGIRKVLALATQRCRNLAEGEFASLVAELASKVDEPAALLAAMNAAVEDAPEGIERKLLQDYLTAIRKRYIKAQAKALAGQLKEKASIDTLEQFMSLQRDRLALTKE